MDIQQPALTRTEKLFLACSTLSPDPLTADALTLSRLRIYGLGRIYRENLLARLVADYGLRVRMSDPGSSQQINEPDWFDLELQGSLGQIRQGLAFLESLAVKIVGKPNPAGDGWHC
uniref:Uncharacterized protein n=1 Tax=Cyanothece sp. (strain PCC 7425 / ATCC 29141) TaxID=395961 RepID=B8HKX9_CYAP4